MLRRGGAGSGLSERLAFFDREVEFEPSGVIYVHAVSVGEVFLALKLIKTWQAEGENRPFLLVPTTATGHALAVAQAPENVRVIYSPLDFSFLIRRVFKRYEPEIVILIESELWPVMISECARQKIPLALVNARLSPRSGRRLRKLRKIIRPLLSQFALVALPEESDRSRWRELGVPSAVLQVTGNIKFDQAETTVPRKREDFLAMIEAFGCERPVVMALSTFAGEEEWLGEIFLSLDEPVLPVIVPRHAERRKEVTEAIERKVGRLSILRSNWRQPAGDEVFVIDSTGELRDWTALASVAVVGKSFYAKGGQNPAEAIMAKVPVICGPHMANFEPLVSELRAAGGILMVENAEQLTQALRDLLRNPELRKKQTTAAIVVLEKHRASLTRTVALLREIVEKKSS